LKPTARTTNTSGAQVGTAPFGAASASSVAVAPIVSAVVELVIRRRLPGPAAQERTDRRARSKDVVGGSGRQAVAETVSDSFGWVGSILTLGPIVDEIARLLMYRPLAADGLARRISSTTVR
jgi:hypothetical protein